MSALLEYCDQVRLAESMKAENGHLILDNHDWGNAVLIEIACRVKNLESVVIKSDDSSRYSCSPDDALIEAVVLSSPGLKSLTIEPGARVISAVGIAKIGQLSQLEHFEMCVSSCRENDEKNWNEALVLIAKNNPELRSIDISSSRILPFVKHCLKIQKLKMYGRGNFIGILHEMQNLKDLESIECSKQDHLSIEELEALQSLALKCDNLRKVNLGRFGLYDTKQALDTLGKILWNKGLTEVLQRDSDIYRQRKPKSAEELQLAEDPSIYSRGSQKCTQTKGF